MIMTVEPGLMSSTLGAVRNSDMVLITEEGFEFLTKYRRDCKNVAGQQGQDWNFRKILHFLENVKNKVAFSVIVCYDNAVLLKRTVVRQRKTTAWAMESEAKRKEYI